MRERFAAAGRPDDEAEAAAALVGEFYRTLAARTGQSVDALIERFGAPEVRRTREIPAGALAQVPVSEVSRLNTPLKLPSDPKFAEAVEGTPGAKITDDGLVIDLTRYQPDEQGGSPSIRTGMFYLPSSAAQLKHYRNSKTGYGGSREIRGETLIRNPLFVKGGTGGNAVRAAYDSLKGKGAYEAMRSDVLATLPFGGRMDEAVIDGLLAKYGADPEMAYEIKIVTDRTGGNTLPYAIQENIAAHAIRAAGHDAMVGWSTGKKSGTFISEVFDVREDMAPTAEGDFSVHESFYQSARDVTSTPDFDPNDPRLLFQATGEQARGAIEFTDDGRSIISLLENADASTALHESGHFFLRMFREFAERPDAPADLAGDWAAVRAWWGDNADAVAADSPTPVTPDEVRAALENGTTGDRIKDLGINVGMQEQWARAFEAYLREGEAPSEGLRGMFAQFRRWLSAIYQRAVDLNVNLTPEIREVFGRMLAPAQQPDAAVSATKARPDPAPDGLPEAEARVGRGENPQELAEQFGVDPATGASAEVDEVASLRESGRLTPEDEADLTAADQEFAAAQAYDDVLRVAAVCDM